MKLDHPVQLTSAELANLWNTYMNDSMAICVFTYFLEKTEDHEIKEVVENGLTLSKRHIQRISDIYAKEQHPIPQGFTMDDVNLEAPPLFLVSFYLHYIKQLSRVGLASYSLGLSLATRDDMRDFFSDCLQESIHLDKQVTHLLLSKGLYVRAPFISKPDKVEFVQKYSFIDGVLRARHRPLLAMEIAHLYANIQTNALGRALLMGFSQVAQDKEVREYMVRGRDMGTKHIEVLGQFLNESFLKTPMTWNDTVTDSTVSPFSDKFMMFHTTAIIAIGLADYGASLAISLRKDMALAYTRLIAEIGLFAEDGANIMIKNSWMEQAPQALDRNALARS